MILDEELSYDFNEAFLDNNHRVIFDSSRNSTSNHHHRSPGGTGSNYTVVSTVRIRVTPLHDYFVSWYILWACFVVSALLATWQVVLEYRQLRKAGYGSNTLDHGDPNLVSVADITRCFFRRFLLAAMIARAVLMPVQIWSDPMWWQFVGDTLPEVLFASAWSLLVSFFVQLHGIIAGTLTDPTPGFVIQVMIYVVYIALIVINLFNATASILLYTLLCGVYATLFGILIAFGPRWLWQVQLTRTLAIRLAACNTIACLVFGLHTFSYGQLVIAPPRRVYWWYQYGALELIPATLFLLLMKPSQKRRSDVLGERPTDIESGPRRTKRRPNETIPIVKKSASYGTTIGD